MPKKALRFGISDGAGNRAATWKLWAHDSAKRSEVYLACRALGGELKASLHASGEWHVGYSQETFEAKVKPVAPEKVGRFIQRWPRPVAISPGITLAFRIVTPSSAVSERIRAPEKAADIVWLPNAPGGKATEIDVFFVASLPPQRDWPGKRSMGTALVGSCPLRSGETVWAVYWVIDMPKIPLPAAGAGRYFKGRSRADIVSGRTRALIFGNQPDGSRVIYDCVVEVEPPSPGA